MLNSQATTNGHSDAFENAACDVLAAMYFDNAKIAPAEYQYELRQGHFPTPELGLLFKTMCDLMRDKERVNDTTILARMGSEVDAKWLTDVLHTYTPLVGDAFETNCKHVLKYGVRAGAARVTTRMTEQLKDPDGKPTATIILQGTDILTSLQLDAEPKSVQADEISTDFDRYMSTPPDKTIQVGLPFLDSLTGGFTRSDVWMIAGAYKMRKTTLMLNMCLNAALSGASVTFLSREMNKRQVAAQLICMLAVGDLLAHNEYDVEITDKHRPNVKYGLNWISPRKLMLARDNYRQTWDKRKVRAIDHARVQFNQIGDRLRIYDTTPEGGKLSDIASAELLVKRDIHRYGCDIFFADYLQLFDAPGTSAYDKQSYSSRAFQSLTKRENVTGVIAAQRSEEAIKSYSEEAFAYSMGIKGGGDASAVADFALLTQYKHRKDVTERQLEIIMMLSRHGSGGQETKELADIHPSSGLLLESNFAMECKQKAEALQNVS
jgi:replicative DNA helicase